MKFAVFALATAAALAGADASAATTVHVRVHVHEKQNDICYKQCPTGQWCARGTQECRAPKADTTECFNYATATWIPKCDAGFYCKDGKCEQGSGNNTNDPSPGVPGGAICYKQCPGGQWCARGTDTCRAPKPNSSECFNYATALWIPKCDPGFYCKNGKCEKGAHKSHAARKPNPGVPGGAICYKPCDSGKWCARGTQECRAPTPKTTECFDLSQGLWIPKCGPGFSCKGGKCA